MSTPGATLSNADAVGRRKEVQSSGAVHDALLTNRALAQHMDFSGTPAFVVMPQTQNGDVKRVTVIPEARLRICCKWRFRKRRGDIRSEENAQE